MSPNRRQQPTTTTSGNGIQDDLGEPVVPSANDAGKSGAGQRVMYLLELLAQGPSVSATGPSGDGYFSQLTGLVGLHRSRRGKGLSSGVKSGVSPWVAAGSFLHTGLNSWAHVTKQPQRPGTEACSPAPPSPRPARLSVSDTGVDLAEKADIAIYEDDDEHMGSSRAAARLDRRAAAEAFRAIACDESLDDGLRSSAAEQLPGLDPRAAAEAFRLIASDPSMTVAKTVAKPLDGAQRRWTTLEYRPSARTATDGPGGLAHSYG